MLTTLRNQPDADAWYETRPYQSFPEDRRVNNLTAGSLRGPGKLAVPPLVRARRDEGEAIAIVHVGRGLCGHDGIVHGGLLATLLDESLARIVSEYSVSSAALRSQPLDDFLFTQAISNLPEKVGVTANLSIDYRAPTKADQVYLIAFFVHRHFLKPHCHSSS
jgi:acyl-coenzyme A thioesterase PaaI-like protein